MQGEIDNLHMCKIKNKFFLSPITEGFRGKAYFANLGPMLANQNEAYIFTLPTEAIKFVHMSSLLQMLHVKLIWLLISNL